MSILLAFASVLLAGPFHEADSAAWRYRVTFETNNRPSIPGGADFHAVPPADPSISGTESGAATLGRFLRLNVYMPRRGPISWFGGLALGLEEATWELDVDYAAGGGYTAEMTLANNVVELSGGAEIRVARRHFLALEAAMPIALGGGELEYVVDGEKILSGDAPSSFALSMLPRLAATYDYRLFDRIDLGVGYSFLTGGYFADTPVYQDGFGDEVRLESGEESGVFSLHLGWTFGG